MTDHTDPQPLVARHAEARQAWTQILPRLADPELVQSVDAAGRAIHAALVAGRQLLVVGNGGSAAMSSHIAAEFAGKCVIDREPLPALSLAESSTTMTAVGNDYGFEQIFVRGVRAHGREGDVLLAMSTSGTSPNVLAAIEAARSLGLTTVLLTGAAAPEVDADHVVRAPTAYTPRIQEVHLLWAHAWCEGVDTAWATKG